MKKKLEAKQLRLNKETLTQLDLKNTTGGGILSWFYDCEWQGVSRGFSNCNYCN